MKKRQIKTARKISEENLAKLVIKNSRIKLIEKLIQKKI